MRLTLRTLLAYLDQTLEPNAAETLGAKIAASGFASQLADRVKAAIANGDLGAVAADAVGPLDDANVMGEYLDSTLTPEQVAEIERACLETDVLLGEAAACHQILTIALGTTPPIGDALRQRVYRLPVTGDSGAGDSGAGDESDAGPRPSGRTGERPVVPGEAVSSVAVFAGVSATGAGGDAATGGGITPVGPEDSGVNDAASRIARRDKMGMSGADGDAARRLSRRLLMAEHDGYFGGRIRTSRVAPWLVTLGLAAGLLFALVQIFRPVLDRRRVDDVALKPLEEATEPATERPTIDRRPSLPPADEVVDPESVPDVAELPDATDPAVPSEPPAPSEPDEPPSDPAPSPDGDVPMPEVARPAAPIESTGPRDAVLPIPPAVAPFGPEEATPPATPDDRAGQPEAAPDPDREPAAEPDAAAAPVAAEGEPATLAVLKSADTFLIAGELDTPWRWVRQEGAIDGESAIVCPPLYRAELQADGIRLTLFGPTRAFLRRDADGLLEVELESGRVSVSAEEVGASFALRLADRPAVVRMTEADASIAVEAGYDRSPGVDPRRPENRRRRVTLTTTTGGVEWTRPRFSAGDDTIDEVTPGDDRPEPDAVVLGPSQRWVWEAGDATEVAPAETSDIEAVDEVEAWISGEPTTLATLDRGARDGLLTLVSNEPSLVMSLREAVRFRRPEVAGLAARTLLLVDQPDVYFGGDGILNQDRHRAYWTEHYLALVAAIDRSAESARAIDAAIEQMYAADHEDLFRLLVGYSQRQLAAGGDAELVEFLHSPSMAIRVLAIENLRRITGTTLYYKAWESSPSRRDSDVKKWQVRLRRGDIRWPE